ncbi:unnamed protein product [Clavelina lepadiformis]|uniref:VWFA domain-containing protein n=1 Tax=Clavelina lepadiformis TaxID=159417 RepID=A0ABP0F642_CLALP
MTISKESESTYNLYVGAPSYDVPPYNDTNEEGIVYICPVNIRRDKDGVTCSSTIRYEKSGKIGISMDADQNGKEFVVCGNRHSFICPDAVAQQRYIGVCYKHDIEQAKDTLLSSPCTDVCPGLTLRADIIFVLDESGSVNVLEYGTALDWVIKVLASLRDDIDRGNVRVGVISFADNPYIQIALARYSYEGLEDLIGSISKGRGGTYIGKAIKKTVEEIRNRGRERVPAQMILLTDGYPSDDETYEMEAINARSLGIITLSVGVGTLVSGDALDKIAGDKARVFKATDFDDLDSVTKGLGQVINDAASVVLEETGSNSSNSLTQCQLGTSTHLSVSDNLFVGAVGSFDRMGSVASYTSRDGSVPTAVTSILNEADIEKISNDNIITLRDSYLGYSVASGYFFGNSSPEYVASGAPRYHSKGAVFIYNPQDLSSEFVLLHPNKATGLWQLGAYFGHSLCSVDLNKDSFDDLLVSAPLYSDATGYDQGRVFVILNDPTNPGFKLLPDYRPQALSGSDVSGARFGMTITNGGDIDQNGFDDIIVGAPMENLLEDVSGAVYIYYASTDGISSSRKQRIQSSTFSTPLHYFGMAAMDGSKQATDVDGNQYPDVIVSAPSSDAIIVLQSRPVIDVKAQISASDVPIDIIQCANNKDSTCTTFEICLSAKFRDKDEGDVELDIELSLDSLVKANELKRLVFGGESTTSTTNIRRFVNETLTCYTLDAKLNVNAFSSSIGGEFFQIPLRVQMYYKLSSATTDDKILSPVVSSMTSASLFSDWSFQTGCSGLDGICEHDLSAQASYSLKESSQPFVIGENPEIFTVNLLLKNNGPDHSYSTRLNVSAHPLVLNKISGDCFFQPSPDTSYDETVLNYKNLLSTFSDLMNTDDKCHLSLQYSLMPLTLNASVDEIYVHGTIYSNAGSSVVLDPSPHNNNFAFRRKIAYSGRYFLRGSSSSDQIFYNHTFFPSYALSLMDPVLGGKESTINHHHSVYNVGPNILSEALLKISWPAAATADYKLPILYLYNFSCTPREVCKCNIQNKVNRFNLKSNNASANVSLTFPTVIDFDTATTCSNSFCETIDCSIKTFASYTSINVLLSLKVWIPTLSRQTNLKTVMSSYVQLDVTNSTIIPRNVTYSSTASLTVSAFYTPATTTSDVKSDIGAIVGGVFGGVALLSITILAMWKAGFFESKYAEKKKQAMAEDETTVIENSRSTVDLME